MIYSVTLDHFHVVGDERDIILNFKTRMTSVAEDEVPFTLRDRLLAVGRSCICTHTTLRNFGFDIRLGSVDRDVGKAI